jgi:hypothetical protein
MRIFTVIVTTFIAMVVAGSTFAASDVTKLPGYVDFDTSAIMGDTDAMVEINLSEAMLKFMAGAANLADQEIAETLNGIVDLRIKIYELESVDAERVHPKIDGLVKWFEKNQWSRVIHVKEETETVNIYSRLDGGIMSGLALVVASESELVFINIVGTIDPARLGALLTRLSGEDEIDLGFLSVVDDIDEESEEADDD